MPTELHNDGEHRVFLYKDLVTGGGIQSNQFLVIHGEHTALLDPGGALTYIPLSLAIGKMINLRQLDYVIASHQDPDIIASLDRWLLYTDCRVAISRLWERFLPHLVPGYMVFKGDERIVPIPDEGMDIPLGDSPLRALPAHFLHSVGNFSFYDPISSILFSGDVGASTNEEVDEITEENFDPEALGMQGFHQRYMNSNRTCRFWVKMVRQLGPEIMAPQHGAPLRGRKVIGMFLDWLEQLPCGVDLMEQRNYVLP
ncbi:MAG: MBL fold metallo-hydrolase [Gammaproteobacteria bacterium]